MEAEHCEDSLVSPCRDPVPTEKATATVLLRVQLILRFPDQNAAKVPLSDCQWMAQEAATAAAGPSPQALTVAAAGRPRTQRRHKPSEPAAPAAETSLLQQTLSI